MEKLDKIRFGIAGGFVAAVFVLFVEIFLWIKFVPLYNSIMINVYGTVGYTTGFLLFISALFILLGILLGFALTWLFAWVYNKLLNIKLG